MGSEIVDGSGLAGGASPAAPWAIAVAPFPGMIHPAVEAHTRMTVLPGGKDSSHLGAKGGSLSCIELCCAA